MAEAVEAGGAEQPGKLLDRQTLHGRQQSLPDEQGYPRWPRGDNRWGTYTQIQEAGGQVRKGEKAERKVLVFHGSDEHETDQRTRQGKVLKDKDGKTDPSKK